MIRVFCDKCGKEIDHNKEGINVDFNHYGVVKFRNNEESKEFQLCKTCANGVYGFIKGKKVSE